ncbi:MAG: DUF554 domain-containing protein [Desulfovibrionaceae bacterium]|nr:DUF554 domain-containing protein [Desulfovibrionaceae bacterium]
MVFPVGPLINAAAVIAGGILGLALGARLPERMRTIVFQGLGLCTLLIGMQMAFKTASPVILIFSILIGGLCGEAIRLEERLMRISDRLKTRLHSNNPLFTEGLVNATVLFCIGAMAILGSFDEGLRGDRTLVYSKSIMDGFSAIALASAYGLGVSFAAVPVLLYQGGLVLFAGSLQPWLGPALLNEITAVGGLMVIGIGLNLLKLTHIPLTNMIPALPAAAALAVMFL